jgi:hypothetical protein
MASGQMAPGQIASDQMASGQVTSDQMVSGQIYEPGDHAEYGFTGTAESLLPCRPRPVMQNPKWKCINPEP